MRFFTNRNFRVVADTADGEKVYGYGRSVWAMIDTETRQPTDILAIKDGSIRDYIEAEKTCPIQKSSRVKMGPDAKLVRTIDTQYSDVDINGRPVVKNQGQQAQQAVTEQVEHRHSHHK